MKKAHQLWFSLSLIFIIVFNIIVFLTVDDFTTSIWVSYAFIHFAYFLLVVSSVTVPRVKDKVVFGYPLVYVSILYFIVEFVVGLIYILIKEASFKATFIPQFILAAIYGFIYLLNLIGNEASVASEQESIKNISYIKNAAAEINILLQQIADPAIQKKLEKLYDAVRSSQVKTYPALAGIESNIMIKIENLKERVINKDFEKTVQIIDEINNLISERNNKISLLH